MKYKIILPLVTAISLVVVGGLGNSLLDNLGASNKTMQPSDKEAVKYMASGFGCGKERWAVKTLTDPAATQVDFTPLPSKIADLISMPVPANPDGARTDPEKKVYRITATLTGYKEEADSDYHLVLNDAGKTMIAEIPAPGCITPPGQGSPTTQLAMSDISQARSQFEKEHSVTNECFNCLSEQVSITGVAFFDRLHGQTGVAPNGIELHPVLSYAPGSTPKPPVPPVTTSTTPTTPTTAPTPTTPAPKVKDRDYRDDHRECSGGC